MYIPNQLKMADLSQAHDFIEQFGFGVLISQPLNATHLPFILARDEGEQGTLYGHFARANPHWKSLHQQQVMAIFHGPHGYVSPTWYANAPAVPTWNYAAVHSYGELTLLDDPQTLQVVEQAVARYEPALLQQRTILTDAFRDKLLAGIVGFKMELSRVEGKLKLGQQRSEADQAGVFAALNQSTKYQDRALADYMRQMQLGTGEQPDGSIAN